MPRNGSGIFTLPSGYQAETGDLILAEQHNSPLEDIRDDLNAARPIVAGGTGATTAGAARTNLSVPSIAEVQAGYVARVTTKTALKALDTALYKVAFLEVSGTQKLFTYTLGDFTDAVAGDPTEQNYIPADGIAVSIGVWVAVTGAGVSILPVASGGTGSNTAEDAREALGLAIGADVQAYSANLDTLAAVTPGATGLALLDDATAAAARTTISAQEENANLTTLAGLNAADVNLPSIVAGDARKYLRVKEEEDGYELAYVSQMFDPRDFGVAADWNGATGTNDAAAFNAMIAAIPAGSTIVLDGLWIRLAAVATINKNIRLLGDGTAKFYGEAGGYVKAVGALSAKLANLTGAAYRGDDGAALSSVAGLSPRDLVIIQNHLAESLNAQRPYYYDGEFQTIKAIAGLDVDFTRHLHTRYPGLATDEIYKVTPTRIYMEGVEFEAAITSPWAFMGQYLRGFRSLGCDFIGGDTRSAYLDKCYDFEIDGGQVKHTNSGTGSGYGWSFSNSQKGRLRRADVLGDNHSVAMGGNDANGSVPCREIVVECCQLSNQSLTQSTVDIHGNAVDCGYERNTVYGSVGLSGHRPFARRNKVYMKAASTTENPFTIKEFGGGSVEYSDNEVFLGPNYAGPNRVISFEASSLTQLVNEDFAIICDRNIIHSENTQLAYFGFFYWNGSRYVGDNSANAEIDWHIRCNDNIIRGNIGGLTNVLRVDTAAASPAFTNAGLGPNSVEVNTIKTDTPLGNTVQLCQTVINAGGGSFGRTRYTLPEYATSGTITIPSGGYQSGNLTLDHPVYPGVPECFASASRGFSGANMVHLVEVTATTSQRTVRLAMGSTALTVASDYARNTQIRVGMRNRLLA